MLLSVIIPAYNEAGRIPKTLKEVDGYLRRQAYEYEILVVDDGSKDRTTEVVRDLGPGIRNLRLLENRQNRGKGWAVRQGMFEAKGDIRLFMDADNSTTVDQVENFLPYFEQGYDVVIGSRRIEGSVIAAKQPWLRDFLGGVFRFIVHTLVPVPVTDTQAGFKAFSKQAADLLFPRQTIFRWAFDVEILALAALKGLRIREVPIRWVNDAQSHVKLSGMVRMLIEVLQIRRNLWRRTYA